MCVFDFCIYAAIVVPVVGIHKNVIYIYERPPKPPTIRNSFTRTLVLDTVMKLSGTIGVTQKTMTLIHMFASF